LLTATVRSDITADSSRFTNPCFVLLQKLTKFYEKNFDKK